MLGDFIKWRIFKRIFYGSNGQDGIWTSRGYSTSPFRRRQRYVNTLNQGPNVGQEFLDFMIFRRIFGDRR